MMRGGDPCGRPRPDLSLRQVVLVLLIPFKMNKLPMLAVAGGTRPACHFEQCIDHFLGYWFLAKLAHCAQAAQQPDNLLWVFCLYHNRSPLFLMLFPQRNVPCLS